MATYSVEQQRDTNKQSTHLLWNSFWKWHNQYVNDLLFDIDTADSFKIISSKIGKTNFLTWAGLRHSVPLYLKTKESTPSEMSLLVTIENKEYYTLIKSSKAKLPNNSHTWDKPLICQKITWKKFSGYRIRCPLNHT